MNLDNAIYVVVFEHKLEGPLVRETKLASGATREKAEEFMRAMAADPKIIRVAIGRIVYETGNECLIPAGE